MAQLNIKPAGGQKLQLQRHTGADALVVDTHGDVQLGGSITAGTITNAVSVPQEVIKKMHHFTNATRVAGNSTAHTNQFTWTTAFTPLDPDNNQFHIHACVGAMSSGNDQYGFGIRLSMDSGNAIAKGYAPVALVYDFMGKGVQVCDQHMANRQTMQQYNFVIGAGTIKPGTYRIFHHCESPSSHMNFLNPNTSDHSRCNPQYQAEMMITEYGNI